MAVAISMVMLSKDIDPSIQNIKLELSKNWPKLPSITDIIQKDNNLAFNVGANEVVLGKMSAPIPWSDLEGPCSTSILWKNAKEVVKKHKIHWIVTLLSELESFERSKLLTQITASFMAACTSAIGVYWYNAALIVPKNLFIEFANKVLPYGPPLQIWVDFRVGKDTEKSSSGFTTGLPALGHMEFEAKSVPERPKELYDRLVALAGYVLEQGPVIKDGDTVGRDANERIRIVYTKSVFGKNGTVMQLQYEYQ